MSLLSVGQSGHAHQVEMVKIEISASLSTRASSAKTPTMSVVSLCRFLHDILLCILWI